MTTNELKDFLRTIRSEQQEIAHLRQMVAELESELLPQAIRYDRDKVQVSPEEKFSKMCAKIVDYEEELGRSIAMLYGRKVYAEQMIKKLDDAKEREVLRLYYLTTENGQNLTWNQVAIRMNYFERHVKRIHGNALVNLAALEGGRSWGREKRSGEGKRAGKF